jgi:hypothetical protein
MCRRRGLHRGAGLGGSGIRQGVKQESTELSQGNDVLRTMTIEFRSFGRVTTMNPDYPYKAATGEEDATVLLPPDHPGYSSFPCSGKEGVLPNADIAAAFEVAARCQNPDARPHESSSLQRSTAHLSAREICQNFPRLAKTLPR